MTDFPLTRNQLHVLAAVLRAERQTSVTRTVDIAHFAYGSQAPTNVGRAQSILWFLRSRGLVRRFDHQDWITTPEGRALCPEVAPDA